MGLLSSPSLEYPIEDKLLKTYKKIFSEK